MVTRLRLWAVLLGIAVLASIGTAHPSHAAEDHAAVDTVQATSCYGGAAVYSNQPLYEGYWTGWYYGTTTARCADLNVRVDNYGCSLWVDAWYYSSSQGTWIDGAHDDFWMLPGYWYTPITNIRDGTPIAVSFYSACTGTATIKIAY